MIIDTNGNIIPAWLRANGPVLIDEDNKYGIKFSIALEYNDTQKSQFAKKATLKKALKNTDYRALKYADGCYTEEEYAPYKAEREAWREQIREIEKTFSEPTLTRDEIDEAERLAMEKLKEG